MKKRKPCSMSSSCGVRSDSRVSWQIIQSGWILGIFLLLLLVCALLADLARSNRAMLHPSGSPSLPASTPCRAIELTAPDSHLRVTENRGETAGGVS